MPRKILIVEANDRINEVLAAIVTELGYARVQAANGREAVRYLNDAPYAAVLLNLELPDVNGIEVLKYITQNGIDAPVAIVSEVWDIDVVIKCLENGAYDYVLKPFAAARVKEAVEKTISKHRLNGGINDFTVFLEEQRRAKVAGDVAGDYIDGPFPDAVTALVRALEFRERGTSEHAGRVSRYAVYLGRRVGLSDEQLRYLSEGALLHDIGKICVPDFILRKEGPLTPEEWGIMKQHPVIGYNIVKGIKHFAKAAVVILSHHERYDGTGYPYGLTGERIPISTRVFSVVDAFDAVVSDRPYAKAETSERALAIIEESGGTQFDPAITRTFLQIADNMVNDVKKAA